MLLLLTKKAAAPYLFIDNCQEKHLIFVIALPLWGGYFEIEFRNP